LLEVNRSAVHLDLSNQNLHPSTIRPILKALQHQNSLLQVDLSSNFIGDEGLKFLTQMVVTLKELEMLNISGNTITEIGLENLSSTLVKSQMPAEIRQLKVSFNPIGSSSLKPVSALCQSKNITSLSMTSCDLTETNNLEQLTSVKNLDISYNQLTAEGFKNLLKKLNSAVVETINLERCSSEIDIGNSLVQFISSGCYACLKEINLAGLNFNENEILDILRSIEKCEQLKTLDLSYQKQLTFLSLKYILVSMDSPCLKQVKLIGCKSLQNSADLFNLQSIDGHRQSLLQSIQMSLPKATSDLTERTNFIERMKELWDTVSRCQGKVEHNSNILCLTQGENDDKENPFDL
jgi:Leucine Rich repeat